MTNNEAEAMALEIEQDYGHVVSPAVVEHLPAPGGWIVRLDWADPSVGTGSVVSLWEGHWYRGGDIGTSEWERVLSGEFDEIPVCRAIHEATPLLDPDLLRKEALAIVEEELGVGSCT